MSTPIPARTPSRKWLAWGFWLIVIGFIAWDFQASAPIDVRDEPPLIAAGSGRSGSGGHCATSK